MSYKHWIQSEIIFVKDFFHENGELLNENFIWSKLIRLDQRGHDAKNVFHNLVMKFDTDGYKYINTQNIYLKMV